MMISTLARASLWVFPSAAQPGSSGTSAINASSACGRWMIRRLNRGEICGRVEVEVLRASLVNATGVRTPDLVGCPQNDSALFTLAWAKVCRVALWNRKCGAT